MSALQGVLQPPQPTQGGKKYLQKLKFVHLLQIQLPFFEFMR